MLHKRISIKDNNAEAALFRRRAMVAMAGVIVLSVLGLIFNLFLQFLERKLVPWNHKE